MNAFRWRDRQAVAPVASVGVNQAESSLNGELSRIGLEHAAQALRAARPADDTQARYVRDALARIRSKSVAINGAGVTPSSNPIFRDGSGPCAGCATVRHAFASVSDAIAAALRPGKHGPMAARIEAQQSAKPGPLQAAIDRFHGTEGNAR